MVAAVLERPALVLNKSWQTVGVASVRRALTLVWNGSAKIVDSDYQTYDWVDWTMLEPEFNEPFIKSARLMVKVPEVITLLGYNQIPAASVTFSRRNIFKRDRYTCQYCGKQPGPNELTIDHVHPRALGGTSSWGNCVLACVDCNKLKDSNVLPYAGLKLKKLPIKPDWKPMYATHAPKYESWKKFLSEAYWTVPLVE